MTRPNDQDRISLSMTTCTMAFTEGHGRISKTQPWIRLRVFRDEDGTFHIHLRGLERSNCLGECWDPLARTRLESRRDSRSSMANIRRRRSPHESYRKKGPTRITSMRSRNNREPLEYEIHERKQESLRRLDGSSRSAITTISLRFDPARPRQIHAQWALHSDDLNKDSSGPGNRGGLPSGSQRRIRRRKVYAIMQNDHTS
jgi:hypothetical protein